MFANRVAAARQLARELEFLRGDDVVVLGLPRGGVPVAAEIARSLDAPLDVIVVRKLGVPFQPELAMGAIGEDGIRVLDPELIALAGISAAELATLEGEQRKILDGLVARLRRGRRRVELAGRVAVIVDDGIATGSTARAACQVARRLGAARVIMAAPVAPADTVGQLVEADAVVCVSVLRRFVAVGAYYRNFEPIGEDEVIAYLAGSR